MKFILVCFLSVLSSTVNATLMQWTMEQEVWQHAGDVWESEPEHWVTTLTYESGTRHVKQLSGHAIERDFSFSSNGFDVNFDPYIDDTWCAWAPSIPVIDNLGNPFFMSLDEIAVTDIGGSGAPTLDSQLGAAIGAAHYDGGVEFAWYGPLTDQRAVASVSEPATATLAGLGLLAAMLARRRYASR